ncbi:MAG: HypC/HybG/HupF family hydrogenase formation chaperone [Deltaproteobacteria bacterium]|nr:HypC/HybG/HupF family hydrogenase formation chaperone [Deltaproteobacteria bacterium]
MCIAVPGKIISIDDINMAIVDYGGTTKAASLDLLPEVEVGDYVLVHAGFAINRLDEEEAMETIKLFEEYMMTL